MKTRELLRNFLYDLDKFLSAGAVTDAGIRVVFATEPQKIIDGYIVYGAVDLEGTQYPFELRYNKHLRTVEISSQIFWFRMSIRQVKKFEEEINKP
jgi:hypothetical protein